MIIYDPGTQHLVRLPRGEFELTLGRLDDNDIPVFIHKDRGKREIMQILTEDYDTEHARKIFDFGETVSRRHAILVGIDNRVYLQDRGSRLGTKIKRRKPRESFNVMPNEEHRLHHFDEIVLGKYGLVFIEKVTSECEDHLPTRGEYKLGE